jgi:NADH dehydrogenase [ubiquinone] 1 alpha subcomplex assembly factor 7
MTGIIDSLKQEIKKNGPKRFDKFFEQVVGYYYANNSSIGAGGDFITAPEISQLFGEMIAVWIITKAAGLESFNLVELGAGNGTLMADILHVLSRYEAVFSKLARVSIVEISPYLQGKQQEKLQKYQPKCQWFADIAQVPDGDNIIIANEFFDALPVRQFRRHEGQLYEMFVDEAIKLIEMPSEYKLLEQADGVYEVSEKSQAVARQINEKLGNGQALIIDYGYFVKPLISTLQTVNAHQKVDLLYALGESDITYHVDFVAIAQQFAGRSINLMTQADFLIPLGIELRAHKLNLPDELTRLVSPKQMGELFKVMIVT